MSTVIEKKKKANDIERNQRGFNYSVKTTSVILKIIGAWPYSDKMLKIIQQVCYSLLFIFIFVPGLLHFFMKEHTKGVKVKILANSLSYLGQMTKYILLIKSQNKIKGCIEKIKNDWMDIELVEDFESMMSSAKLGKLLTTIAFCLIYGGSLSTRIIIPIAKGNIVINNVTIRPLGSPAYFIIFNPQISPAYEIVYFTQILATVFIYSVMTAACCVSTFLVTHVCGQFNILIRLMKDAVKGTQDFDQVTADSRIGELVKYHSQIRRFIDDANDVLGFLCLVEMLMSTIGICSILYLILLDFRNITHLIVYTIIITSFVFKLFIYSYIGELLMEHGTQAALVSSTLDWENIPLKSARSLIFVIIMSNRVQTLEAGNMMTMSLRNFNVIMRSAIGYFNIFRDMI